MLSCRGSDSDLYQVNLSNLQERKIASFEGSRARLGPDGQSVYYGDRDGHVQRFDMSTSSTSQLFGSSGGSSSSLRSLSLSPDGSRLALVRYAASQIEPAPMDLVLLSTSTGASTTIQLPPGSGTAAFLDNDSIRVDVKQLAADPARTIIDFDSSGTVQRARASVRGDLIDSPAHTFEALQAADLQTGFVQLLLAATTTVDAPPFALSTFIRADHQAPAFSLDGHLLYYFCRDPMTGFTQLFRVAAH